MTIETVSTHSAFGGEIGYYHHASATCRCDMRFTVFVPPEASHRAVPVVTWLSGLTCTEDNFTVKSGAYKAASALGLMIIAPDTSPRGLDVADDEAYDLGQGAGFYLDATEAPWAGHFNMYSYITSELPEVLFQHFSGDRDRQGIMGHSMGGHGALTIWLKNPGTYRSVSAFAPICAPSSCPWGEKAFTAYIGADRSAWADHDASTLMKNAGDAGDRPEILIDQGLADGFLDQQLNPGLFERACAKTGQKLNLRRQESYDHSYFFIASFIDDHLEHHANLLKK